MQEEKRRRRKEKEGDVLRGLSHFTEICSSSREQKVLEQLVRHRTIEVRLLFITRPE